VNSVPTYPRRNAAAEIQYFLWQHPEWWSVAICVFAWVVLLSRGHTGHSIDARIALEEELLSWVLMVAAMMLPLVTHAVRITADRSLWTRRSRAIGGFLAGYFAPWLVLGIMVAGLRRGSWAHTYLAASLAFLVAAFWLGTPVHKRARIACHRTIPLAPQGWQAERDSLRFGGAIGVACVCSCWPLMLACAFAGHSLVAMTGGIMVGYADRWSLRPRKNAAVAGTLAIASYYLAIAVF
jgi:predicted metal-binding membrane protein